MGIRKVIFEVNNLDAIQMLHNSMLDVHRYTVARDVKQLSQNQWEVNIQHVNKEVNRVADTLVKQALRWELSFYNFLQPTNHILKLIHDDLEGLTRIE
ncbi:hypothetical protein PVK06_016722 [Gossypium arboreum]|uniref:RNase H type-1 domain-containing protein n=1 Tax=Gossypium arboreum TaxID=29729 RepID=A0ABR0Q0P8_GOSAR|nr:hypothetical protein PVK06_016722 [Gossypium arboreum]